MCWVASSLPGGDILGSAQPDLHRTRIVTTSKGGEDLRFGGVAPTPCGTPSQKIPVALQGNSNQLAASANIGFRKQLLERVLHNTF